jgi:uncharacterized membrane protein
MTIHDYLIAGLLSLAPISELRGAIPFALTRGASPLFAYIYCVGLNALVAPIVYLFLSSLHRLFLRMKWYTTLFNRVVERTRKKIDAKVARYEYLGITLFVAIPLPITGAWTGTLGAWLLGLHRGKTILHVLLGVAISGAIVLTVSHFGLEALSIFTKQV